MTTRLGRDGPIPDRYNVFETPSDGYLQRTEWNVRDTDGTVVFTLAMMGTIFQRKPGGLWR